jgi:hypothetical protein
MIALLVDMVPGPDLGPGDFDQVEQTFRDMLDHYVFVETPPDKTYRDHHSVGWGFGEYARLSWAFDTRYHAFGTFDSLRKIPLAQYQPYRHVNQGFHTLHYSGVGSDLGAEIWDTDTLLMIKHYKMLKLFSQSGRDGMIGNLISQGGSQYHARTTENILHIFQQEEASIEKILSLPSRPVSDGFLPGLDPRSFGDTSSLETDMELEE